LAWVDKTYYAKHEGQDPNTLREAYYPNLRNYPTRDGSTHSKSTAEAITMFLMRFGKKAGISLAVFALSYVPYVGRLVLPAASFYTFKSVAGWGPAGIVFGTGIFLPRRYLIIFLQSYFASRSLMRELVSRLIRFLHPLLTCVLARAVLFSYTVYKGTEKALVPRPRRAFVWLWCRILHLLADSPLGCSHLWNC